LISRGGSLYARLVLGVPVRDLTGGFKCFRRRVLETIDLDAIAARGYGFQIEGTYRALRAGFRVVEIPIRFVDRRVGESKMSGAIVVEAMRQVPALRWKALRGTL
jgi:dolichol-phosphate mannosyltransferase